MSSQLVAVSYSAISARLSPWQAVLATFEIKFNVAINASWQEAIMDTQIYNVVIVGPEVHFKVRSAGKHYDFALTEGALAACARQIGQDVHEDLAKLEVFEQYEDNIRPIVMDILDQVEQQDTDAFVIDTPDIDIAINNGALAAQQTLAGKS